MAKSFLKKIRKYRKIILIAAIIAFILLVILGFILGPDKTWGPGASQNQTEGR
jgi:membrane-bound acyltransferase YfiQ involved in biofilm formation